MAIVREFVFGIDNETDYEGWIPKGMKGFNAGDAISVAHDTLDHFSPTDTSIEGEFLAFGSILYLRAEGEYWAYRGNGRDNTAPSMMWLDMCIFVCSTIARGNSVRDPGRTRRLDEDLEEIIDGIRTRCINSSEPESIDVDRDDFIANLERAFKWMRKGYRKAHKRWQLNVIERITLFDNVYNAVHRISAEIGGMLRVSVNKHTLRVTATVSRPYDNY